MHLEKAVVDAGFLELVRLGVKAPDDPYVAGSLAETDASLATDTPSGRVWHRYTFDGYGERADGRPWDLRRRDRPGRGRCWPASAASTRSPTARRAAVPAHDGQHGQRGLHDPRAGLGPARRRTVRLPARQGDRLGVAAGVGDGAVRPARARDRAGRPVETPAVCAERYVTGDASRRPAARADGTGGRRRSPTATRSGARHHRRRAVYVGVGGENLEDRPHATARSRPPSRSTAAATLITVVAEGRRGGHHAPGHGRVLRHAHRRLTDPAGDDNGPGTYVYPGNPRQRPAPST